MKGVGAAFGLFVVLSCALLYGAGGAASGKPNIIVLIGDDLSPREFPQYDTGNWSSTDEETTDELKFRAKTPMLDKIAKEGIFFDKAWATPIAQQVEELPPSPLSDFQIVGAGEDENGNREFVNKDTGKVEPGARAQRSYTWLPPVLLFNPPNEDGQLVCHPNTEETKAAYGKGTYGPDVDMEVTKQFMETCADEEKPFFLYATSRIGHKAYDFNNQQVDTWSPTPKLWFNPNGGVTESRNNGTKGYGKDSRNKQKGPHVQMFIYAPGMNMTKQGRSNEFVSFVDIVPTVADLMGASDLLDGYELHGQSQYPYLFGEAENHSREYNFSFQTRSTGHKQLIRCSYVMKVAERDGTTC
ncbi:hypothetical protein NDN08_000995 [Rhodosorus marinus]|uniref:Sulfatase N-terminal domain-containing protein n=1 Tax=Rhodosorus marinus TaxID=101924 RepID=A0AAV8UTT4_9RHOD|nr:hypothetical protein NDN08_000995 [Rhodosorus marinus]